MLSRRIKKPIYFINIYNKSCVTSHLYYAHHHCAINSNQSIAQPKIRSYRKIIKYTCIGSLAIIGAIIIGSIFIVFACCMYAAICIMCYFSVRTILRVIYHDIHVDRIDETAINVSKILAVPIWMVCMFIFFF